MSPGAFLLLVAAVIASALLTGRVRYYAVKRDVLDHPGPRSSHEHPTPRGGGLAAAIVTLGATGAGAWLGWVDRHVAVALVGGGSLVAVIGWIDDHRHVRARVRLLVHFAAAAWALWWLGGFPEASLGTVALRLGAPGAVVAALGIVWCINFYNFMDGIDGLAAVEGAAVGAAGCVLLVAAGKPGLAFAAGALSAAVAGFLPWNWPPARIFLGDVGSGFLGFCFATLSVASENGGGPPAAVWALLLGVFVFDATVTLARRLLRREVLVIGHRQHAYQRAVQAGWSHRRVTLAVAALNVPLALLAVAATLRPTTLLWCLTGSGIVLGAAYLVVERCRPMLPTIRDP